ncbi:hypothetical protein BDAP_001877 [Binucleata daphniae]
MTLRNRNKNDVVLIGAKRTPFTKAHRGAFANVHPDIYLTQLIQKTMEKYNIKPKQITSIAMGNVLIPQGGVIEARSASIKAGIPINVPIMTINRQCASGLDVLRLVENEKITMLGGFESMSKYGICSKFCVSENVENMVDWRSEINNQVNDSDCKQKTVVCLDSHAHAKDCIMPMGETSENVAKKYSLTREEIDKYAFESHQRSYEAQQNGYFDEEIVTVCVKTIENEKVVHKQIQSDDGIRKPDLEKLKTLKPVFVANGVSTAGNSSQLTDGASISFFTTREYANEMDIPIQLVLVDIVSVGVEPSLMGIAPVPAITKLLQKNNLDVSDISFFEINEAFGSQAVACMKELNIPREKYNVNGGGIGIGHPVGATGGRLICTMNRLLKNVKNGYGVISMCAATGLGTAVLFYKE